MKRGARPAQGSPEAPRQVGQTVDQQSRAVGPRTTDTRGSGRRTPSGRGPEPVLGSVQKTLASVLIALGWVMLGLASLAAWVGALWITLALARTTQDQGSGLASAAWTWLIASIVTLGVPFALAAWKHHGDAREMRNAMTWLPLVWNAGGLVLATQLVPDLVGTALRRYGAWSVAGQLGDSHSSTRVMSALGHHAADAIDPMGSRHESPALHRLLDGGSDVDTDRTITKPFTDEGTAIIMEATLEGPLGKLNLPYLFDTGASFTTISRDTAALLGIDVPEDAPTLEFNTASGPRESRMVYLPALSIENVRITGLLVSVCDACENDRTRGLLGLNVMREFFVQMDYKNHSMTLLPRIQKGPSNRAYDIEPVVDIEVEGSPEVWLGRVRWVVTVRNRGSVPIEHVTPLVKFAAGPTLMGRTIARIEPRATGRSLVEGRAGIDPETSSSGMFTLTLHEAYW